MKQPDPSEARLVREIHDGAAKLRRNTSAMRRRLSGCKSAFLKCTDILGADALAREFNGFSVRSAENFRAWDDLADAMESIRSRAEWEARQPEIKRLLALALSNAAVTH